MYLLSIILPCYNESKSIEDLHQKAIYITQNYNVEIIFLNNGSIDNSWEIMTSLKKYPKIKFIKLLKNKGYGYGIKYALKYCEGNYIGWTHADLQTDLFDVIKAYKIINNFKNTNINIGVKGLRFGRPFIDKFTSDTMSLLANILFLTFKLREINAQPSIYSVSILEELRNAPDNYNFDIFAFLVAYSRNFKLVRFPVLFPKRIYGSSHWNVNFLSKIIFIFSTIKELFKMRILLK